MNYYINSIKFKNKKRKERIMNNLPTEYSDYVINNWMRRRLLAPNHIPLMVSTPESVLANQSPTLAHNILSQQVMLEKFRIERNSQVSMFNNGVRNLSGAATELARDPTTRGVEFYRYRQRTRHLFRSDEEIEVVGVRKA